jgi:hypothetical protein
MLNDEGHLKLIDFGSSFILNDNLIELKRIEEIQKIRYKNVQEH